MKFREKDRVQFVAYKNDEESSWIDPVIEYEETDKEIVVDNGYHRYEYIKTPEYLIEIDSFIDSYYDRWELRQDISNPVWYVLIKGNITWMSSLTEGHAKKSTTELNMFLSQSNC